MPFRRRRHHPSPRPTPEVRIAAPLARMRERLAEASTSLDTLMADLGNVASLIRDAAAQAAHEIGGDSDDR